MLLLLFFALAITIASSLLRIFVNDHAVPFSFGISFPISVLTGFIFVVLILNSRKLLNSIAVEIDENEAVLKTGGSNHIVKNEGVGGKPVLTDRRLIFTSHKFNVQNHRFEIPIDEVLGYRDWGLVLDTDWRKHCNICIPT